MFKPKPEHKEQFQALFGVPYDRFHTVTGFDLISFDEWLGAGGRSIQVVATERFGEKAADLLRDIIINERS